MHHGIARREQSYQKRKKAEWLLDANIVNIKCITSNAMLKVATVSAVSGQIKGEKASS